MFSPNPSAIVPFLRRLQLRSALNAEEREAVLNLPADVQQVQGNRDFVTLGQTMTHACLIVDGLAGRFEQTRTGKRQITAVHLPGDMADLHSVVLPKTSWALQALSRTTIARVPHQALVTIADRHPALARAFWRDCTVDSSIIAGWTVSLGLLSAKAKLAHLICELRCRYAAAGLADDDGFTLPMTQAHLGEVLGLTPVHVNRMAKELRDDRLASISDRRVTIIDWPRLVRAAEFDPAYLHLDDATQPDGDGVFAEKLRRWSIPVDAPAITAPELAPPSDKE